MFHNQIANLSPAYSFKNQYDQLMMMMVGLVIVCVGQCVSVYSGQCQ